MKPKTTKYVLKHNIPGGFKKGDIIVYDGNHWVWPKYANMISQYDPTLESYFFAPVVACATPAFKDGSLVYFKKKYINNKVTVNVDKQVIIKSSTLDRFGKFKYTLDCFGVIVSNIPETEIWCPETYWFINSRAKVCSEIKTEAHMKSFVYKFRIVKNNVFETIEEARKELDIVMITEI